MSRRVSMKGKGADIFFGEYTPPQGTVATIESESESEPVLPIDTPADASREEADEQARMQASKNASKNARAKRTSAPSEETSAAMMLDSVWDDVTDPATITNSFRYTERELAELADVLYDISKRHGVRLTKQEVARLGLNMVLAEYQACGDASLLGTFAQRKKRR